jgi:hypothetical protein
VPVNGGSVEFEFVLDGNLDQVTPACLNPWPGVRLVEDFAIWVNDAVAVNFLFIDLQVILIPQLLARVF